MTIHLGNQLDKSGLELESSCRQMVEEDTGSSPAPSWLPPCPAGVLRHMSIGNDPVVLDGGLCGTTLCPFPLLIPGADQLKASVAHSLRLMKYT